MRNLRLFLSLSLLLTACGYRWEPDYPHATRPSVTVPYAIGDEDGFLTAEIAKALSSSGLVDVVHVGGDYRLEIIVGGTSNETIGYRRDPQKVDGKVRKNLLACEGRKTMSVTAVLFHGGSEEIAYGPYEITADADYDYVDGDSIIDLTFINAGGVFTTVLPFSLGQLEPIDSAQEAATKPLYAKLAQKMVDVISLQW